MYSFCHLEPVCSMSSSNCCFLTCIQISQVAGQVVWYSHLFQNFPQFVVIHSVKGFGIVNKAEIDVFLDLSCFFGDPTDVGNLLFGSSAFSKSSLYIWKSSVHVLLKLGLKDFEYNLIGMWNQRSNCHHLLDHRESKGNSRKTSTSASLTTLKSLTVDNKLWKILKEMGIPTTLHAS